MVFNAPRKSITDKMSVIVGVIRKYPSKMFLTNFVYRYSLFFYLSHLYFLERGSILITPSSWSAQTLLPVSGRDILQHSQVCPLSL